MAKTTMRESMRDGILDWMIKEYDKKAEGSIDKIRDKAAAVANKALRVKFPEADMAVLRKYSLTDIDGCIKFMNSETAQVFGVEFDFKYDGSGKRIYPVPLADIPSRRGCRSGDVFPVSATAQAALEAFTKAKEDAKAARDLKIRDYKSFLAACKTVDEFNETVPLPDDLRNRYMSGGALIAISPEKIAEIGKDFKAKKASR